MPGNLNVVYLHSHDTGRSISPYGFPVHTPHLHALAQESLLFRRAFCAAPTCSPSRAALLTGRFAHCSGMLGLHHRGFELNDPSQHLAHFLRSHGYHTTLVGVNHVAAEIDDIGYQQALPTPTMAADEVGDVAAGFLRSSPSQSSPFFLDVGFVQTHRGRFPETHHPDDDPKHMMPAPGLPDVPELRHDAALFAAAARQLDDGMGRVLKALKDTGLDQNTLVICTTDHGISFPQYKCNCTDAGLGVMLMLRGPATTEVPGGIGGGRVTDSLVSQIDLYPTVCDLLELEHPDWLQGRSLLRVLKDGDAKVNDYVFGEVSFHAGYEPQRAVRDERFKLIRRFGERKKPVLSNMDDGLSKQVWVAAGHAQRDLPEESMFDCLLDPTERNNLIAVSEFAPVRERLRQRLAGWMKETQDPLLSGEIAPPSGTVVNDPEDYSPKAVLERHANRQAPAKASL